MKRLLVLFGLLFSSGVFLSGALAAGPSPFVGPNPNGNISVEVDDSAGVEVDFATEAKQDAILTRLDANKLYDTGNSTSTPLGISGNFKGDWIDTTGYVQAIVELSTDADAAASGMVFEYSSTGVADEVDHYHSFSPLDNYATGGHHYPTTLDTQYFRVNYTNGTTGQTSFTINCTLFKNASEEGHVHPVSYEIDDDHPAAIFRAIQTGKKPNGEYVNAEFTAGGVAKFSVEEYDPSLLLDPLPVQIRGENGVNDSTQKTAFGETSVANLTPVIQLNFNYNINTDIVSTAVTGSGTVTQANSKAALQTTAATSSSASFQSIRSVKYPSGQGIIARFSGVYTDCAANSTQLLGIGDATDGFFFGCNGADFGVLRRQNTADTWVAQTAWSEDKAAGAETLPEIIWTNGNGFQIRYQWLGFGMISYWVEDPSTGLFVCVHQIEYANANTDPSVYNPTLPLYGFVENTTNATNVMVQTSSMGGFVEGKTVITGPKNSISNTKSGITTELNVLTIRNKSTFASKTNRVIVKLNVAGIATDGTKNAVIRLVKNATLGGTPSYTDISTNTSIVDYDVAGTTVTGGKDLFTFVFAKVDSKDVPLKEYDIEMNPGDTLTVSATSSSSTEVTASFNWVEDF